MVKISDYTFRGKRVLVRVDFNVPFDEKTGLVADDSRILRAVPTVRHILSRGGKVILVSHMGRPKGKPNEALSLQRISQKVSTLMGAHVQFEPYAPLSDLIERTHAMQPGEIMLLENIRFYEEEEGKVKRSEGESDDAFAERRAVMRTRQDAFALELSRLGDCYVNDAFGAVHRAHASTALTAHHFAPEDRMFGFLVESELRALDRVMNSAERPLTAIMGGAKVSDKIKLIDKLLPKIDRLIIGGGMTYTFIKAQGGQIGKSLCEEDMLETAKQLLVKAREQNVEVLLPVDAINADTFAPDAKMATSPIDQTPTDWMGLDIGPDTAVKFRDAIVGSKTVFWNGPMGVFEFKRFAKGTFAIAEALALATEQGAYSLVGGGDSVSAVRQSGRADSISYLSTGGGAMLEYLEGKPLPGIVAIRGE